MNTTKDIMIVGVGGQGSLLASKLLGSVLLAENYDVKVSEVHGMSQRGGSVVTYVKYGEKVYSPVICRGEADIILSFEELEAARWLPYMKKDGLLITNTQQINPMPVVTGAMEYPADLIGKIKALGAACGNSAGGGADRRRQSAVPSADAGSGTGAGDYRRPEHHV